MWRPARQKGSVKKRVLITLAAVLGLVGVGLLGVVIWYWQGGLDDWFERRLKADLAEMNIRLDVEGVSIELRPGKVVLTEVELHTPLDAPESAEPFARVERLVVEFEVTSLWARKIDIQSLTLDKPVVTVRFDEEGRSNLDPIDLPETEEEAEQQLTYLMATVTLNDGQINYGDATRRIDGTVDKLQLSLLPKTSDDDTLYHQLVASFADSKIVYEGRELAGIRAELKADVREDGATIETLTLETPAGTTEMSGTVRDWSNPTYEIDVGSTVSLDQIGRIADPNAGIAGSAALSGKITGTGASYTFQGNLSGNNVLVAGVRVADLAANGKLQGERLDYAWIGNLVASRLTGFGLDITGIRFDGRVDGNDTNAAVNGALTASRIASDEFTGEGFRFEGRADLATRSATGDVGLTSIATRTVRAGRIDAQVTATADRVDLDRFTAVVYDGTVSGSARVQLAGGTSSVEAVFRGVDVDDALGAATADAPRVRGSASGSVNLAWPGTNVQAATGTIRMDVDGNVPTESGDALPLDGELAITAVPGRFRIDRAEFTSGSAQVTASGSVGWNRRADLDITAEAADTSELIALATAVSPDVARALDENRVQLGGEFRFEGNVSGALTDPNLSGQVSIGSITVQDEPLGSFSGSISRLNSELRLEGGTLRNPDGSEIAFDVTLPSRATDARSIRATVTNVPLERLFKVTPLGTPPVIAQLGGRVTGTVDLQLPSAPDVGAIAQGARGTVDLEIADARFGAEPVRDFRIRANLGEETIEIPSLRIETARGALDGSVVFDKRTDEFRARFDADSVDLALLREVRPDLQISGTGTGTLAIAGALEEGLDARITDLTANVTGANVVVNGQQVGDPRLTIDTVGGVSTVRLAADVLGERRELAGTIRINAPGMPFEFVFNLQDANLVPYASLAGVTDLPEGLTTDVTGTLRVAGMLNPSGESIAETLEIAGNFSELSVTAPVETGGRTYTLANRGNVVFTSTGEVLSFERTTFTGAGTELTVVGDLALAEAATSNLTISGDVNLALLTSTVPDAFAAGIANVQATIGGTLAEPRFSGFADVRDASLRIVGTPVAIQNGNGRIIFNSNQAYIESFAAQANGGRVNVDGGVLFAGLEPSRWRFGIDARQVRLNYPEDVRSIIDGNLTLQGNQQLQVLSGVVDVRRAEYTRDVELADLLNIDQQPVANGFGDGGGPASPIRLDLRIEARDSLIIRNNLADAVASANLQITGPLNDPIIDGRVTVSRGTINFRNDDYQISRGVIRFPGRVGDITFDLQAESEIRGYRITVGLTGTPERPTPVLRSEPPLPETQIASLILTGELGGQEDITTSSLAQSGVGLASSLLSAAVSESVQKRTSKLFGINRFQISPDLGSSDPSARVTLGRQINKNLAIIYTTNVTSTNEQIIQIEYRISDRFSVVATRDEDGAFGIDFRVKKRF